MATFEKSFVQSYGSLEKFAKEDGCYKIYESDGNYHAVRKPADEQGILTSPYVKNPRLVWEKNIGMVAGEALEKIEKAIEPKDLHLPPAIEFTGAPAGPLEHVPEKDSNLPPKKRKQVLAVIINLLVIIAFASLITAIVGVFSRNWILAGTMFGISIVSFVPFFFPSTQRLVKEGTEKRNKKKIFSPPFKRHTDKRNLEWMIGALKDENIQVRKKAASALCVIGDRRAVEPLIKALKDSNSSVRANAARALGKIGDRKAMEPLTDALKDSNWQVRENAKTALRKIQAPVGKKKQDPAVAASENALSGGIVLGVGSSGIGIGMGDSLMESLVKMGTKCRKCGSEIIFEDGAACARKNGIRDNVVMCKKCRSVYEVDLSPSGMSLTTDVSHKYRK